MANTPQAKKRIRRNANRATVNHSRISRIRTFIKQVESAIASGKKADAAEALKASSRKSRAALPAASSTRTPPPRRISRLSKRVASLG